MTSWDETALSHPVSLKTKKNKQTRLKTNKQTKSMNIRGIQFQCGPKFRFCSIFNYNVHVVRFMLQICQMFYYLAN